MANMLYSGSGDARLAENLAAEFQYLLADRFSLLGNPAIKYVGNCAARGSTVLKVPLVGLGGYDRMSGVAENASTSPTTVTLSSATITVGRQAIERGQSDVNEMVDMGALNIDGLVADGMGAYAMRWMELLCSLVGGFSTGVTDTGVDADVDDWFALKFSLIQGSVPGPYLFLGYPTQCTDIIGSARAEGGAFQYRSDVQDLFAAQGQGVLGELLGVPMVSSSLIPTANAGADSAGGMFGPGAIGYADGLAKAVRGANDVIYAAGTKMYTEFQRDASATLTKIVHNAMLGMSRLEQRGRYLITDR